MKEEGFERSNCQIWGDRALVQTRASRGPDASETSLKGVVDIYVNRRKLVRGIEKKGGVCGRGDGIVMHIGGQIEDSNKRGIRA